MSIARAIGARIHSSAVIYGLACDIARAQSQQQLLSAHQHSSLCCVRTGPAAMPAVHQPALHSCSRPLAAADGASAQASTPLRMEAGSAATFLVDHRDDANLATTRLGGIDGGRSQQQYRTSDAQVSCSSIYYLLLPSP